MPFETKSSWLFAIPQAAPLQASGAGRGQRSFLPRRAPGLGVGRPGGWAGERTLRRDRTLPPRQSGTGRAAPWAEPRVAGECGSVHLSCRRHLP